ncbi:MAG: PEP-CTERM sorting domain-containing protein [Planctomycetota bacterium]
MNVTTKLLAAALAPLVIAGTANATVVYEDTYEGDGLATNNGTGGGMTQRTIFQNAFSDAGSGLDSQASTNAARRAVVSTDNAFNLSEGFILEVHYQVPGDVTGNGLFEWSMSPTNFTAGTQSEPVFSTFNGGTAGDQGNSQLAIGVAVGSFPEFGPGVYYNNGLGNDGTSVSALLTPAGLTAANTEVVTILTVNADNTLSFSVDGNVTNGAHAFDLSSPLYFNVLAQPRGTVNFARITAIPEPSSLALLGLGGLLVARRRRG